jgi:probable HAF family extracellular repeat protein
MIRSLAAAAVLSLAYAAVDAAPPKYLVVDISFTTDSTVTFTRAHAINNKGLAVGYVADRFSRARPARWTADGRIKIETDGGKWWDINDAGKIVGYIEGDGGATWKNGMTKLTVAGEIPDAINKRGDIAGDKGGNGSRSRTAYLRDADGVHPLGKLEDGKASYSDAVNDLGHVVGRSAVRGLKTDHAFIYRDGVMTDLGFGAGSYPSDINNKDEVVGDYSGGGFLWKEFTAVRIPPVAKHEMTSSLAINESSQVVGYAFSYDDDRPAHAFIYQDGRSWDLNDLLVPESAGWFIDQAFDINDRGMIVAQGYFDGVAKAVKLLPVAAP